jgi:hypothetical protein
MCKSVYNSSMDIHTENNKMRKSLAVDVKTYDLLQEICDMERRSKIDQLKVLIEKEHARLKKHDSFAREEHRVAVEGPGSTVKI